MAIRRMWADSRRGQIRGNLNYSCLLRVTMPFVVNCVVRLFLPYQKLRRMFPHVSWWGSVCSRHFIFIIVSFTLLCGYLPLLTFLGCHGKKHPKGRSGPPHFMRGKWIPLLHEYTINLMNIRETCKSTRPERRGGSLLRSDHSSLSWVALLC